MIRAICVALLLCGAAAAAQEMPTIDRDSWNELARQLGKLNIPLDEHARWQQILKFIEDDAKRKDAFRAATIPRSDPRKEPPNAQ